MTTSDDMAGKAFLFFERFHDHSAKAVVDSLVLNQLARILQPYREAVRTGAKTMRDVLLNGSDVRNGDFTILLTANQVDDLGKRLSAQLLNYADTHAVVLQAVRKTIHSVGLLDVLRAIGVEVASERNPRQFRAALVFKAVRPDADEKSS